MGRAPWPAAAPPGGAVGLSAMGFFTVDPATANHAIGSPVFDEVTIHPGNGKGFVGLRALHGAAQREPLSARASGVLSRADAQAHDRHAAFGA
jgi:hypothetical protein